MSVPGRPRSPRRSWGGRAVWLILIVLVLGGLTLLLWARYPEALGAGEAKAQALQYIGIAALVASGALLGRRVGVGAALRSILAWGGLGVMLILGYGYRDDIALIVDRLRGEPAPTVGQLTGERALTYRASASGHFVVEARVGDVPIRFLVDTGASPASRLRPRQAPLYPALRHRQRPDPGGPGDPREGQPGTGHVRPCARLCQRRRLRRVAARVVAAQALPQL